MIKTLGKEAVSALDAVFITHEHTDHVRGLGTLGRRYPELPVHMHKKSYKRRSACLYGVRQVNLRASKPVEIKDICVFPFRTIHDTANAFGFYIEEEDGPRLTYLTDTGDFDDVALRFIDKADALLIEGNYDDQGLNDYTEYSQHHKERIRESHLSNQQTLDMIDEIGVENFSSIIMAHLSPRTNKPEWVAAGFEDRFPGDLDKLHIAPLDLPLRLERCKTAILHATSELPELRALIKLFP